MDTAAVIRRYGATALGAIGVALWLVALYCWLRGAELREFDRWLPWILLINIAGLLTLVVLLARKLSQPGARLPRHVPGLAPEGAHGRASSARWRSRRCCVVYYFSLQFLNRGIDSWFELEVSQGLKDALRAVARRARPARARVPAAHRGGRRTTCRGCRTSTCGTLDRERRASTRARIHRGRRADAASSRPAPTPMDAPAGAARPTR